MAVYLHRNKGNLVSVQVTTTLPALPCRSHPARPVMGKIPKLGIHPWEDIQMKRPALFNLARSVAGVRRAIQRHLLRAALALALFAAGCGDDGTGPEGPTLDGTWKPTI